MAKASPVSKVRSEDKAQASAEKKVRSSQDEVLVFISYASADNDIARAMHEELSEISRTRVKCFLDTETIGTGKLWKKELDDFLQEADWLVCIYTGEQSEFCGYEVGVFEHINNLSQPGRDSPVVCLHDVPVLPTVFHPHQNRLVIFPSEVVAENNLNDENEFYFRSPLAKFFLDIYEYKDLYKAEGAADSQRQKTTLIRQVKRITEAFKAARGKDVRADTPIPLQIELQVATRLGDHLEAIPDTATISGTYASLALFDLLPPMESKQPQLPTTTWSALKAACSSEYRNIAPWIERVERNVVEISKQKVPSGDEATLTAKGKVYRAIISRHVLYENGAQAFYIMFVETLPRQFLGKKHTSLILAGIVLAARFRFAYLEEKDIIKNKFDDMLTLNAFESNCWQLYYDLENLRNEAIQLGILDLVAFVKAFGDARRGFAENLMQVSIESRKTLEKALPALGERIDAKRRVIVKDAIYEYFAAIEPINAEFLLQALELLKDEIASQIEISRLSQRVTVEGTVESQKA